MPPSPEGVLARYGQAPRPTGEAIKANIKGLFRDLGKKAKDLGKQAKALKLQHDIKTLQTAVETQLETLAKLALTHRPAGLDFQRELAELGQVQNERGSKQGELNALAQTPGSGTVAKQLKKELSDLNMRERQLMVAIGRAAATVRPDMPDGAAQYGALDRLNATLSARQQEVEAVQRELAASGGVGLRGDGWKKPAMAVGGVGGVLIAGYLLFAVLVPALFGGGGVPKWAFYCIPEDAKVVGYIDMDKVRESELLSGVEELIPGPMKQQYGGSDFDFEDVSEVFAAGDEEDMVAVVRMQEDCSLKSLLPKELRDRIQPKSYKDVEYISAGRGVMAKTADRTFCFASNENLLKDAISRLDRKERAEIDKNLQVGLNAVSGGDIYFVATSLGGDELPFQFEAFHSQAWLGSSLQVQTTWVFEESDDAEKAKKMVDGFFAMADEAPAPIKTLLEAVTISQKGKYLYGNAKWKIKDIKDLLADANKFSMPF